MSKPIIYKGFRIKEENNTYYTYTKEEWAYDEGYRSCEWEACSLKEAQEWVDCYD